MIHFALRCRPGAHEFDGWFRSNADFEVQCERALVTCPICGANAVEKALMRPALSSAGGEAPSGARAVAHTSNGDEAAAFRARLVEIARQVRRSSSYVGARFAEEARRMHFGEAEAKPIWGEASGEEVRALVEDGVPALPLPRLPEDGH